MQRPCVVIVGGGITGLSAAWELERAFNGQRATLHLLEGASELGGVIKTERRGGYLVEQGPDSFLLRKPATRKLVDEIGAEDQLIEPRVGGFSILAGGRLRSVPSGLPPMRAARLRSMAAASFIPLPARIRCLLEPWIADRATSGDESVERFLQRRLGERYTNRFAAPLLAGIHGARPDRVSMNATFPGLVRLTERHGSLLRGLRERSRSSSSSSADSSPFASLKGGMASLIQRLSASCSRTRFHSDRAVDSIAVTSKPAPLQVQTSRGALACDALILATPAAAAAGIVRQVSPRASRLLRGIKLRSSTMLSVGIASEQLHLPPNSSGFIVPQQEPGIIHGCTFSSAKWSGRAPAGHQLLRVFLREDACRRVDFDSTEIQRLVIKQLEDILALNGTPDFTELTRWERVRPLYELGHSSLVAEVREELHRAAPVWLAGASYRGVGIADCIAQGRRAAKKVAATIE